MTDANPAKVPRTEEHSFETSIHSTLQCSLCLCLLCEPISIPCGHTFCRVCLVESMRRHKKRCPSCRAVCHIAAESAPENIVIKTIALLADSDTYNARLAEALTEKEKWSSLYPIFYYNSVMFPGSKLSLHLFEPRYRNMMQRIVNTTQAFAYVPNFANYQAHGGDVAIVTKLQEVTMLPDGRCFLEAVLASRHQIVDHFVEEGTQGLHYCRLIPYKDHPIVDPEQLEQLQQLRGQAKTLADCIIDESNSKFVIEQRYGAPPSLQDSEAYSLWLSALAPGSSETDKMMLMTTKDTKQRFEKCIQLLGAYISARNNSPSAANLLAMTRSSVSSALRGVVQVLMNGSGRTRSTSSSGEAAATATATATAGEGEEGEEEEASSSSSEEEEEENEEGEGEEEGITATAAAATAESLASAIAADNATILEMFRLQPQAAAVGEREQVTPPMVMVAEP